MAQDKTNNEIQISTDNAILLLAAAQELGLPADVVGTTSDGVFTVPQQVVDKAGLGGKKAPSEAKVAKAAQAVHDPGQAVVEDPAHPEQKRSFKRETPAKSTQAKAAPAKATQQKSE